MAIVGKHRLTQIVLFARSVTCRGTFGTTWNGEGAWMCAAGLDDAVTLRTGRQWVHVAARVPEWTWILFISWRRFTIVLRNGPITVTANGNMTDRSLIQGLTFSFNDLTLRRTETFLPVSMGLDLQGRREGNFSSIICFLFVYFVCVQSLGTGICFLILETKCLPACSSNVSLEIHSWAECFRRIILKETIIINKNLWKCILLPT